MRPGKSTTEVLSVATSNPYIPALFFPLLGIATLAAYTLNNWLSPIWPVIIGGASIAPITLGITVFLHRSLLLDWKRNRKLHAIILIVFALSTVPPAAWLLPQTRTTFLNYFGSDSFYEAAMEDWSNQVRQTACRQFVLHGESTHKAKLALADHPHLAQSCITKLNDESRAEQLAIGLANHWHNRIVNADSLPADNRCTQARILTHMPIDKSESATTLLDCVLRTESDQVRGCCTKAARRTFGQCGGLLRQVIPSRLMRNDAVGPLVGAAFGQKEIAERLGPSISQLGLDCTPGKWFAAKLLCQSVQGGDPSRQDALFFDWLMSENAACLGATADRSLNAGIDRICRRFIANISPKITPGDAICEGRRQARKAEAAARRAEMEEADDRASLAGRISLGAQIVSSRYGSGGAGGSDGGGGARSSDGAGGPGNDFGEARERGPDGKPCMTQAEIDRMREQLADMPDRLEKFDDMEMNSEEKFDKVMSTASEEGFEIERDKIETMELLEERSQEAGKRLKEAKRLLTGKMNSVETDKQRRRLLECVRTNPDGCPVAEILDREICKSSPSDPTRRSDDIEGFWRYHRKRMNEFRKQNPGAMSTEGDRL